MTSGKIAWMTAGIVVIAGAIGLGAVYGPRLMHSDEAAVAATPPAPDTAAPAAGAESSKAAAAPSAKAAAAAERVKRLTAKKTVAPDRVAKVPASEPELDARLKPVLNPGAKMAIASEGFKDGEQFAAVAHAARNTGIPFMVLKHRVLDEHETLARAIRASRPDLNVTREAARAHDAARFDIAAISG